MQDICPKSYNLAQKTEVIIEHFREFIAPQVGGQAKAMVVTSSRLHAVNYYKEFKKYIEKKGYKDIGTLVAFSGTVIDEDGVHYKEVELNGFREKELLISLLGKYKIRLVADKYHTGFGFPIWYVCRYAFLGVKQYNSSRLNRTDLARRKTSLDFVITLMRYMNHSSLL